jgi:carbon storage regulator
LLVLTRKKEQIIRIGKDIVIKVLKIQGDQVSIGIQAPLSFDIVREELLDTTEHEHQENVQELETQTIP